MSKQVIPAGWHCNGLCAGLQMETFVPVLLDSKKSHYLQGFFQFSHLLEYPNDAIVPSSFPPIATFFNCTCLNIKRLLSGKHILVKFPVTIDFMQIKLFYYDHVVKSDTSRSMSNQDILADLPNEVTDSSMCSAVNKSKKVTTSETCTSIDTVPPLHEVTDSSMCSAVNISKKATTSETCTSIDTVPPTPIKVLSSPTEESPALKYAFKAIGDISTSEDSDDERLDATILKKMEELRDTDQEKQTEPVIKNESSDNSYDNIEDLVVFNTDVRKKSERRVLPPRNQPKRKPAVTPQIKPRNQKRNFMLEATLDIPPKRKVGRPSKAFMLAKKTAEIKFKNMAQPILRDKKSSDDSCEESNQNKNQDTSSVMKIGTGEKDNMEVNSLEKLEAPVEHHPIVERNAIDLVRKKLERLIRRRSKEPTTVVENLLDVDQDEEKPLFAMDDNFFDGSSNTDITVTSNHRSFHEQDSSAYIFTPPEGSDNLNLMQDEIEPSSATSSISSEGALVVHDILFDDL